MKTTSNSSPLAACTDISCTASWPSPAWCSPASSEARVRKETSAPTLADGAFVVDEGGGGVDQFIEVLQAILAFLFQRR